jgi:hypothetical protein
MINMSDTTFWDKHMVEVKRGEKYEHSMQKVYDWSDEDQKFINDLVRRMYDAGLNFAEIKYELDKIIGIVLYELEIDLQL